MNVPSIEVGAGNEIKTVEPVLIAGLDQSGNLTPIKVNSEGAMETALPEFVDVRLRVLSGTGEELDEIGVVPREIVINEDSGRIEYGSEIAGRVDPLLDTFTWNDIIYLFGVGTTPLSATNNVVRDYIGFITIRNTTVAGVSVTTSTGYARGLNWNGSLTANAGTGSVFSQISPSWLSAASPYNNRTPKLIAIWSTDSTGNPAGHITSFTANDTNLITAIDTTRAKNITSINLAPASNTHFLTRADFRQNTQLSSLSIKSTNSIRDVKLPVTDEFSEFAVNITGPLETIDLRGTNISNLSVTGHRLTHVNMPPTNEFTSGASFANGTLTSINVNPLVNSIDVSGNLLPVDQLNKLYTDLIDLAVSSAPALNYTITVTGNPGVSDPSHNPTIATAKGYTVIT